MSLPNLSGSTPIPPAGSAAAGSVSCPERRIRPGTHVEIVGESPYGVVSEETIEPVDGVERMYLVRTWRTASELREVAR